MAELLNKVITTKVSEEVYYELEKVAKLSKRKAADILRLSLIYVLNSNDAKRKLKID